MKKNWQQHEIENLYALPYLELIFLAHRVHRENFPPDEMELCALLSVKTGNCPEDCAYCPQSGHYKTGLKAEKLISVDAVLQHAHKAKEKGATRFCIGAAWRSPPTSAFPQILAMIKGIKALGLETCATLGMLNQSQAQELKNAGLDFYNHNLDSSAEFYKTIISTRPYQSRLDTLRNAGVAGLKICCGGILGMGESRDDRIQFLLQLSKLPFPPESVPLNRLIPIPGTPLANAEKIDDVEFIKTLAIARVLLPRSMLRLSAGRETMCRHMQAICFLAGANSIWLGNKLLTAKNRDVDQDQAMLQQFQMKIKKATFRAS